MIAAHRLETLRRRLAGEEIQAIIVSNPHNVAYLTGFEGVFDGEDAHAAVITAEHALVYTDGRYAEVMRREAAETDWRVVQPVSNLYLTLAADLEEIGMEQVAIEESVPHGRFRFLSREFEGNVIAVDQWVEEIRQVKDAEEIRRIAEAQKLTDAAFDYIVGRVRPGAVEREIALELEVFMRRNGSEGVAFPPIVASGPNSSLPHAKVTEREFSAGDFVKMDFGARVDGYCADMTRTVVLGQASTRQREVYEGVLAANLAGIAAMVAGRPGADVHEAARSALEERGLAELFTHGLGHGVGMEIHELPYVGPRGTKSVLEGSVVTVEPGVYEPGIGGVRIEDLVVVESDGVRVLTATPKDLLEL